MIQLFNLNVPSDRGRSDVDAQLIIDGQIINFELKSTTGKSFSTVRDFGPDHVRKWRDNLHWLFAVYDGTGGKLLHCLYASPSDMEPWISSMEAYVRPDFALVDVLPGAVVESTVLSILGAKQVYGVEDAKQIMKKQWNAAQYREFRDLPDGYSLARMVEILGLRATYLVSRGATLNNPHIPRSYFEGYEPIVDEHASRLRDLVRSYLKEAATLPATS